MKSKFLALNAKDFIKGLVLAVLTALITAVYSLIEAGGSIMDISWELVGTTTLAAIMAYLSKNLFTNSKDEFLTAEQ